MDRSVDADTRARLASIAGWRGFNNPWMPEDDGDLEFSYINLLKNPERYTGYKARPPARVPVLHAARLVRGCASNIVRQPQSCMPCMSQGAACMAMSRSACYVSTILLQLRSATAHAPASLRCAAVVALRSCMYLQEAA